MKLKEINKMIEILNRHSYDQNQNWIPEIKECILVLEKEKIIRLLQSKSMRENFWRRDDGY